MDTIQHADMDTLLEEFTTAAHYEHVYGTKLRNAQVMYDKAHKRAQECRDEILKRMKGGR